MPVQVTYFSKGHALGYGGYILFNHRGPTGTNKCKRTIGINSRILEYMYVKSSILFHKHAMELAMKCKNVRTLCCYRDKKTLTMNSLRFDTRIRFAIFSTPKSFQIHVSIYKLSDNDIVLVAPMLLFCTKVSHFTLFVAQKPEMTIQADVFVCIILAFGGPGFFYLTDGYKVQLSDVIDIFKADYCCGLVCKPKVFIIHVSTIPHNTRNCNTTMINISCLG